MATLYFKVEADYQEVEKLTKEVKKLENELRRVNFGAPFRELSSQLQSAKARLTDLLSTAARNGAELERMARSLRESTRSVDSSARSVGTAANNAGASMQGLDRSLNNVSRSGRNVSHSLRETHRAMQDLRSSTSELNFNFTNFIRNFSAASLVVSGFHRTLEVIKSSISSVTNFEAANTTLAAILGEEKDGIKMQRLSESAINLGRATMYTATQVTQLQTELSKLGFSVDNIEAMQKAVLNFAQSTGAQLDAAAATAGAALRMFGVSEENYETESKRYVSAMSAATRMSALNFQAISDNLATFGPMAHSVGFEIEDVLALFGKLRDNGIEASTAMTSLRNIFTKMSQGKIVGMENVKDLDDFVDRLVSIKEAGNLEGTGGVGKAMKMIGPRGGTQFIALMQAGESIRELRDKIRMSAQDDSLDVMGKTMTQNFSAQIEMMKSAWEGFMLTLEKETGATAKATEGIKWVTDAINALTDAVSGAEGDSEALSFLAAVVEGLTATFAVYYAGRAGGAAVEALNARLGKVQVDMYNRTAASMLRLNEVQNLKISTDLKQKVLNGRLTADQAVRITALKREAEETVKNTTASLARIDALIAENRARMASLPPEQQLILAKRIERMERERNILASQREAAQRVVNIGATEGEVAATWSLVGAKRALSAIGNITGLSALANPYVLAAAAVAGLTYIIYKFATAEDASVRAQNMTNSALERYNQLSDERKNKSTSLIDTIKSETASVREQYDAYYKLIEMYDKLSGYSFNDLKKMSSSEIKDVIKDSEDAKIKDAVERRNKAFSEMADSVNPYIDLIRENKKIIADLTKKYGADVVRREMGGRNRQVMSEEDYNEAVRAQKEIENAETKQHYTISKDTAKKFYLKNGFTEEEWENETKDIAFWEDFTQIVIQNADDARKALKKTKAEMSFNKAIEAYGNFANKSSKSLKGLEKYHNAIREFFKNINNEVSFDNLDSADLEDYLSKGIGAAEEKALELKNSLAEATGDKKVQITQELNAVNSEKKYLESIREMFRNGDITYDFFVKLRTEVMGNENYLDPKSAETLSNAYENAEKALQGYREGTKTSAEAQKTLDEQISKVVKRTNELTKQLKDPTLSVEQKRDIKFTLSNLEKTKADLFAFKTDLQNSMNDPLKLTVVVDYLEGKGARRKRYEQMADNGEDGWTWNKDHTDIGKRVTKNGKTRWVPYSRLVNDNDDIQKRKENAQAQVRQEEETESNSGADEKASKLNAIANAEEKVKELRKKIAEENKKRATDNAMAVQEAELAAMRDSTEKTLAQLEQRHKKELQTLDRQREELVKSMEERAKALFDAEENVKKAKDKDYVVQKWSSLSNEQKVSYATANGINLSLNNGAVDLGKEESDAFARRRRALIRKQSNETNDVFKNYETEETKRRNLIKKTDDEIAALERRISEETYAYELSKLNDMLADAKAKRIKYAEEAAKAEREFFGKYGTKEQREQTIREKYKAQVAEAELEGADPLKIAQINQARDAELSKISIEDLRNRMSVSNAFNGLQDGAMPEEMREFLQTLLKDLNELRLSDTFANMDATDQKAVTDMVQQLQTPEKGFYGQLRARNDALKDLEQSHKDLADAETALQEAERDALEAYKEYEEIHSRRENADNEIQTLEGSLKELTDAVENGDTSKETELQRVKERYDALIKEREAFLLEEESARQRSIDASGGLAGAKSRRDTVQRNVVATAENAANKTKRVQGNDTKTGKLYNTFAEAVENFKKGGVEGFAQGVIGFAAGVDMLGGFMNEMKGSLDKLGVDTGEGSVFGGIMDGMKTVGQGASAVGKFMSGDIIGGLMDGLGFISGIVSWFVSDNWAEMQKIIDQNTEAVENLTWVMDKLGEELNDADTTNALDVVDRISKNVSEQERLMQETMHATAKQQKGFSYSIRTYLRWDYAELFKKINNALGTSFETYDHLFTYATKEQWYNLRKNYTSLYSELQYAIKDEEEKHEGKVGTGLNDLIDQMVDLYDGSSKWADQLKEIFTGFTFDDLKSNFKSTLQDMTSTSKTFAEDWAKRINDAVTGVIADKYNKDLEPLYNRLYEAIKNGASAEEVAALRREYNEIVERATAERDLYEQTGILNDLHEFSQDFSKGVGSMTEETASEMNGRITMMQMKLEGIYGIHLQNKESMDNILREVMTMSVGSRQASALMDSIISILTEGNHIASGIQDMVASSYMELREINETTRKCASHLEDIRYNIRGVKENTDNL